MTFAADHPSLHYADVLSVEINNDVSTVCLYVSKDIIGNTFVSTGQLVFESLVCREPFK